MYSSFLELMHRGGPVMWVLLVVSIVAVTLVFERIWFWISTNNRTRLDRVNRMGEAMRAGDWAKARTLAEDDASVYGGLVRMLLAEGYSDPTAIAAVDLQRPLIDRSMHMLSTIITAAPLLGLLGTVTGLINTFRFFAQDAVAVDPKSVGLGLSEALLNTAAGLIVAVIVLFPYNAFRAQVDRTLGRFEALIAAASKAPVGNVERKKED